MMLRPLRRCLYCNSRGSTCDVIFVIQSSLQPKGNGLYQSVGMFEFYVYIQHENAKSDASHAARDCREPSNRGRQGVPRLQLYASERAVLSRYETNCLAASEDTGCIQVRGINQASSHAQKLQTPALMFEEHPSQARHTRARTASISAVLGSCGARG